jgi:predicted nucleic acid-binding Zn ribbon protein
VPLPNFIWRASRRPAARSARETVLAEWRGVDVATLERDRTPAKSTAEVLPAVVGRLGLDRRRAEAEIVKVWGELLDPKLVAHAQPAGVHRGTLFVAVDSSVWLDEIVRYHRKEILGRLQAAFGREMISRLSFRVG